VERRSDDASAGRGIAVFASLRALALAYRSERVTAEDRVVGRSLNAGKKPGLMDRDLSYLLDIGANALTRACFCRHAVAVRQRRSIHSEKPLLQSLCLR
jgi:hypothetical protein